VFADALLDEFRVTDRDEILTEEIGLGVGEIESR
jgi:hypothetical protein